ncbi:Phosphotransferase system mannitol/fructose-specific IIA domain (Ntr-type) [Desulfacinum hydrothermale DSM 13146]|uniref:Phosphotransferase system mannitol/fructose-specific IIA domain (Ntr-type) n=1 Tax=Desulfacinum hydrothermale DSM 13146 TaxID=1121390 RepID=A0A1W1X1Y5_9BACT|nr:PTS sugar transporter subunit IIA [Desulfacinum hydrothermale]SMC17748.1 Phosphotransferase system mannitol/fructose-specific IIA domain (Ntr-type) [Desulfacinum hydrothermale DSM 13146]
MHLWRFLDDDLVVLDLQARDRMSALREIMEKIPQNGRIRNKEKALRDLLDREALSTTGIGGGFAVPHVLSEEANLPTLLFARSEQGVDFQAKDGQPVHLILVAFANPRKKNFFVQCLYHAVQILKDPEQFQRLMQAATPEEVLSVLGRREKPLDKALLQPAVTIPEDDPRWKWLDPRRAVGGCLARAASEVLA